MLDLYQLENKLNIHFKNKNLLKQALTHPSYKNEHPEVKGDNERLEFLGDAVLEIITSDFLYHNFPQKPEGEMTLLRAALVSTQALFRVAKKLDLYSYIFLSNGQRKEGDRAKESVMADAFEALIAAIYLDQGYEKAKEFVKKNVLFNVDKIEKEKLYKDSKSYLQEIIQEKLKITPHYKVLKEEGPDHKKLFEVGVYFENNLFAKGKGYSKQLAEENAASKALEIFENDEKK